MFYICGQKVLTETTFKIHWAYYAIAIGLLFPALLINLGHLTFIDDEAIRALVALEMDLSGNLITPTLLGDYYFNKPPLFNWILLVFFKTYGTYNETMARIPTVIALFGYGATIYYYFKMHFSDHFAVLAAFIFITCGRILFWDSLLGLIDITFSWAMFTLFMVIYHRFEKKDWMGLFIISYLLTAIGFMLKGLPAIVFQGTTLLTYFLYRKQFKTLFHPAHFIGGFLFLGIIGAYYWAYIQYNDLDILVKTLFTESSKRTIVNYGLGRTILHFFAFPFEMIYHFLPWSLFIVYVLHRKSWTWIKSHSFVSFLAITFLANILVYWTSPEVYPRYLLMHAPLIFGLFLYLHDKHQVNQTNWFRYFYFLFLGVMVIISLGSFAPLFLPQTQSTSHLILKTLSLGLPLWVLTYAYFRYKKYALSLLVLFLIVFRIGFNWFVLPDRNKNDFGDLCRQSSIRVGTNYKDQPLAIYKETDMQPTNSFYLTNARGRIIRRQFNFDEYNGLIIIDPFKYPNTNYERIDSIKVRHGQLTYYIGKLK